MNLLELLKSRSEFDCPIIIGDEKMPITILWGDDGRITQEGYQAFRSPLDCEAIYNEKENLIEVPEGNPAEGKRFVKALAGCVGEKYFNTWFAEEGKNAACECDLCDRITCIHRDSKRRLLRSLGGQEQCPLLYDD